jgi:hypothetical protein
METEGHGHGWGNGEEGPGRVGERPSGLSEAASEGARQWRGGFQRGLLLGAAEEENQVVLRVPGVAREERKGGAGGVEGRQILEEQSILEISDHIQICGSNIGIQARRSATGPGGSQPRVSGVRWSIRWTARW